MPFLIRLWMNVRTFRRPDSFVDQAKKCSNGWPKLNECTKILWRGKRPVMKTGCWMKVRLVKITLDPVQSRNRGYSNLEKFKYFHKSYLLFNRLNELWLTRLSFALTGRLVNRLNVLMNAIFRKACLYFWVTYQPNVG